MPIKQVNTTLGKDTMSGYSFACSPYWKFQDIVKYVGKADIQNVSIKGKNTEITLQTSGVIGRKIDAAMSTKLEGQQIDNFFSKLPDYLIDKTNETGTMDFVVSRTLGNDDKKILSYNIGFTPGYSNYKKDVERDHSIGKITAVPYYPERKFLTHKAYSGSEIDGMWADMEMKEDQFTKFMRLKGEAERWQFMTSAKRASPGDCQHFVCIHPWEMVKPEFVDFTKNAIKKEEVKDLVISARKEEKKRDYVANVCSLRAKVNPRNYNVEVVITSPASHPSDLTRSLWDSIELFDVKLTPDDKMSYNQYYESKALDALSGFGSKAKGAVILPFAFIGGKLGDAKDAVSGRIDDYKYSKRRQNEEILEELRRSGIPENLNRTQSCYVGFDKECVIKKIEKRKAEEQAKSAQANASNQ
jgi:hypothetical protein